MTILNTVSLDSNKKIKLNFKGGDLSSDAGLLLIKEFASKIGFNRLINNLFKTRDERSYFRHSDPDILMQSIYQTIAAYFKDDCADELTNDPVFSAVLEKEALASQPTLSRFWNRMDEDTLKKLDTILTGDLLKAELRNGTQYCSNDADAFMIPLMKEFRDKYPSMPLYLRGDSGFASPAIYKACEDHSCKYAIRLKENAKLRALAKFEDEALYNATRYNQVDYAVVYGEFMYQANSWPHPRRVVYKIEKPANQMVHMYTFVVTTMESEPYQILQFYCGRGKMENFIKEGKGGFDFSSVSSHSKTVNANRLRIHALAYNLFNWFRRLVLPASMRKQRVDTIRLKLLKIAARVIRSARYITFKLCSSCPYKREYHETLSNIQQLSVQLE